MKDSIKWKMHPSWEELPTVKLYEIIKQQDWFKNCKKATFDLSLDKQLWLEYTAINPEAVPTIWLGLPYKEKDINIRIEFCESHEKEHAGYFQIECSTKMDMGSAIKFAVKHKRASSYDTAITKIEESIEIGIANLDLAEQENKKYEQWAHHMRQEMERVAKDLGDITLHKTHNPERVEYLASKSYGVGISFPEGETNNTTEYEITWIRGVFSLEELKRIIQIVGTNPRAVAERLLKNK